jgi:sigma-B regulation protein RsbU (phosphoserine phosphatase)
VNPLVRRIFVWLGRIGVVFLGLLFAYLLLSFLTPASGVTTLTGLTSLITGVWLVVRLLRLAMRHAVWRLRNRLIVTYVFIAVVPVFLVLVLTTLAAWMLLYQLTVYMVTSELDRRVAALQHEAENLARASAKSRLELADEVRQMYRDRYPDMEIVLGLPTGVQHVPANGIEPHPKPEWKSASGLISHEGHWYLWAFYKGSDGDVAIDAPLQIADLVPTLGPATFVQEGGEGLRIDFRDKDNRGSSVPVPAPVNGLDISIRSLDAVPTLDLDNPNHNGQPAYILVRSRASAVFNTVFNQAADPTQEALRVAMIALMVIFVIVVIIALAIGVTMTRTITGAVHRLYEGTQRVREGDFSHRIAISGRDQLSELGNSFNQMTENLERLVVVAKEKERLQSEIEIARDVQSQLFPRSVPELPTLRMRAVCTPARMVSGDYYDYEKVHGSQVALTIADVAGKGISAALLMASLQSSLRSQLEDSLEAAAAAGNGGAGRGVSTSRLVSRLNRQLHASTSPEKFATFCLGVYDESSSVFTYTNAGHLPPMLVRKGTVDRLDVNGTVVGAFSFAKFSESRVDLESGDLLVFFTDGITEPENEYGEMFGEDRLADLVLRNAHRGEDEIIALVLESVRQFARAGEAQDDMTILLARRV